MLLLQRPIADVSAIEFRRPERRRDLLWRRAFLSVNGGPSGEVFFPAIYASTDPGLEAEYRLGYASDFVGEDGFKRGIGLRCFLIGEHSRTILELDTIQFSAADRTEMSGEPPP